MVKRASPEGDPPRPPGWQTPMLSSMPMELVSRKVVYRFDPSRRQEAALMGMLGLRQRLDPALRRFFRRCKAGETPCCPRFRSFGRFIGWGREDARDAPRFTSGDGDKRGTLRLAHVAMRTQAYRRHRWSYIRRRRRSPTRRSLGFCTGCSQGGLAWGAKPWQSNEANPRDSRDSAMEAQDIGREAHEGMAVIRG